MHLKSLMAASIILAGFLKPTAHAHFAWLSTDENGRAVYYFGETVAQRNYKLPEKMADIEVFQETLSGLKSVTMSKVESEGFIGKRSDTSLPNDAKLSAKVTYGIHGGAKLDYYTQHVAGPLPRSFADYGKTFDSLALNALVIDTDDGVKVRVHWKGKPQSDAEVLLFCEDGDEEGKQKTNEAGEVSFSIRRWKPA